MHQHYTRKALPSHWTLQISTIRLTSSISSMPRYFHHRPNSHHSLHSINHQHPQPPNIITSHFPPLQQGHNMPQLHIK
ncbi:hypothetical protein M747DRAFT_115718 [Aspergillus niger ATCC 13496]|uniref:Uncharacterized protein n=1 Tax=Aspergillus niger ATCC 13496 TaxID=1353008 RepID=A0A370C946_ASPNG|nr:hypothetical protein M747DRAFT_115718 [Aspergillus niger ATCC 13496]